MDAKDPPESFIKAPQFYITIKHNKREVIMRDTMTLDHLLTLAWLQLSRLCSFLSQDRVLALLPCGLQTWVASAQF